MAEIFLGKDVLDKRAEIISYLIQPNFIDLVDPEGTNVIQDRKQIHGGYICQCLFKLVNRTEPFEVEIYLSNKIFKEIVFNIDISSLGEVN